MTKKAKTTELVKITASPVPPLRQSLEMVMGCPTFYVESVIKGNKTPGGMESARGTQIHKVLAEYSAWCAQNGVAMDLNAFDGFAKGVGSMAASILAGMRDTYRVRFQNLFATEIMMSLDENFRPTEVVEAMQGTIPDSGNPPMAQGTLDALLFFREESKADIDDAKSHPRPFDPEPTLQSKMYALFVFQHFAWVQEITFTLVFVRFSNLYRTVTYTRHDIPALMEVVRSTRERQKAIHADYDTGKEIEAIAGPHCIYCPLLTKNVVITDEIRRRVHDSSLSDENFRIIVQGLFDPKTHSNCPISKYNDLMQLTPEQWLNFNLFYSEFSRKNNKRMKEWVDGTGKSIVLKDFNGKAYSYGPKESESEVYPLFKATADGIAARCLQCGCTLENMPHEGQCPKCGGGFVKPIMPIADLIENYAQMSEGDTAWMGKLALSSTSFGSYLKKKDRVLLHQGITDTTEKIRKVKLVVSRPLETLPDEIADDEDEDGDF